MSLVGSEGIDDMDLLIKVCNCKGLNPQHTRVWLYYVTDVCRVEPSANPCTNIHFNLQLKLVFDTQM